jgi:hypothetical protein
VSNAPAIRVQAIAGWILIAHDADTGWNIAWFDVFGTKKTALEFAVKNKWPHPYRAVRGRLMADQSRHQ